MNVLEWIGRCAVLGKYGMRQPPGMPAGVNMASRFARDAPGITVPLLFHVQWDDKLFPRAGQFELFDLLGSRDKQLIAFPGPHRTATPAAISAWCEFVVHHLEDDYLEGDTRGRAIGARVVRD